MNARWTIGYVVAAAILMRAMVELPAPRWWRRFTIRRELRAMAGVRRRTRRACEHVERVIRSGTIDREMAGRELAALTLLLVEVDQRIDHLLDQLDQLDPHRTTRIDA